MEIQIEKFQGTKKIVTITGDPTQAREILEQNTTGSAQELDNGAKAMTNNKREVAAIQDAVARANKPSKPQQKAEKSWSRRYVTTLEKAEAQGLNHGKSWICQEMDIETKGALPEWEGMAICYVYE